MVWEPDFREAPSAPLVLIVLIIVTTKCLGGEDLPSVGSKRRRLIAKAAFSNLSSIQSRDLGMSATLLPVPVHCTGSRIGFREHNVTFYFEIKMLQRR